MPTLETSLLETELGKFGIDYGAAAESRGHGVSSVISSQQFFDEAYDMSPALSAVVMETAVPDLPNLAGRWHPSGFMVYPLGSHAELGTLRLHVWPQELRRVKERGYGVHYSRTLGLTHDGDIHNHAWDIFSGVLGGYSDDIMSIEPLTHDMSTYIDDSKRAAADIFRVHRVNYDPYGAVTLDPHYPDRYNTIISHGIPTVDTYSAGMHNALAPRSAAMYNSVHKYPVSEYGGWVLANLIKHRDYAPNDVHTIKAGVFHSPTIPYGRFAATLAWNSHRCSVGPDILLRGPLATATYDRMKVTQEEAEVARAQLLSPPAEKVGLLSREQVLGIQALQGFLIDQDRIALEALISAQPSELQSASPLMAQL